MPIDEGKLHKDKAGGAWAESLINDERFKEIFKIMETEYIRSWSATAPSEVQARENFWMILQLLGDFERQFKRVAAHGKLAKRELEDLANKFRPRAA